MKFNPNVLKIDCGKETGQICEFIRQQAVSLRREGAVIGLSGGIDSALCAGLCVKALGKDKVFALILPEQDSNPLSEKYAVREARKLGIASDTVDITPVLKAFGTYRERDKVIKDVLPGFKENYKSRITLPADLLARDAFNFFTLTIEDDQGNLQSVRLKKDKLMGIVAATNTKQRTRMMHLYYYAEKMDYFVCGTTNRTEAIQGFFVKYGDGGVDIEPIAHLYKAQVYQLAEHLDVIEEIRKRTPSPDTFSFEVSDEEFFFRMPYHQLDLLLYAWENKSPLEDVCGAMGLSEEQVRRAFRDFASKYNATHHLRKLPPSLLLQ